MSDFVVPPVVEEEPFLKIRAPRGWAALNLQEVWSFRDLLMALAGRDVKLRYKQTALGVAWVILQPLLGAGVFTFVFGMIAKLPSDGKPYFLFSYAGLLGWTLFSNTLSKTSNCLVGNSQLISKIYFPRLVLPLSCIPSSLLDFAVAIVMMAVLLILYHIPLTLGILMLPLLMAMLLLLAMGIGLTTAALSVSYRDVAYILPVFLQFLLYGSPVAYGLADALSRIPEWSRPVYLLNPLAASLQGFRASLLGVSWPSAASLIYAAVLSVTVAFIGAYSFKKMERKFADVI